MSGLVEDPRLGIRLEFHTPIVLLTEPRQATGQTESGLPANNGNKSTCLTGLLYGSNKMMPIGECSANYNALY